MKTFFVSIAGVKTGNEEIETVSQIRQIANDLIKGLNYILMNKYKIEMIDYNCLKIIKK